MALLVAAVAAGGCGSASVAELPPAAGPARSSAPSGRLLAVLAGRERVLALVDPRTRRRVAQAPAGVGPASVAAVADRLYVTDLRGGALLVYATRPKLALVRRVFLPGGPSAIAVDPVRHRLWVALTARDEVVSLPANGRPRPLVRLPTVHGPDGVAVDAARGTVTVRGGGVARTYPVGDA